MPLTSFMAVALIFAGAVIMAISLYYGIKANSLLRTFDAAETAKLRRFHTIHHLLTFFFLLGYVVVAWAIFLQTEVIGDLFVGLIFFFGAVFVFLGIRLQASLNTMLQKRYQVAHDAFKALENKQAMLLESNSKLEKEIIERQQAEKAARESEERIGQILSRLPIGVFIIDSESLEITYANAAAGAMVGADCSVITGQPCHTYICDAETKSCPMQVSDMPTLQDEHQLYSRDGTLIPVIKTVNRVNLEGRPHFLEAFIDISEKKELEEKLERSKRMEVIGTLAGSVAHDLNNILSGVINYPELMLMTLEEDHPMRSSLETIKKSGHRAAAIVQDLLTLARQNIAISEPVDLAEIINEYMTSPEYDHLRTRYPGVSFTLKERGKIPHIEGSRVHLGKMIMNLVTNSAEAVTGEGNVELELDSIYLDAPVEGYDTVREGEYLLFTIHDNGIGIAPENLNKIFEPFYTNKVMGQSGSGLGMPVVMNTVNEHNGYIQVESTEGQGTTFRIHFPATTSPLPAEELDSPDNLPAGKGERILVVDDLKVQRDIASSLLTHLGYQVETARGGEEALGILENSSFNLILLDMIMEPGIDGLETYSRILSNYPNQKVMLVSGFADADRVETMKELGLNSYIKKPYTLQGLAESVMAVLG